MESYVGRKFGRLTVIKESIPIIESNGIKTLAYICLCDCGKEKIIRRGSLQANSAKSCGCLNDEMCSALGLSKRKLPANLASGKIMFIKSYNDGNLLFEDFVKISKENCHYCDAEPANSFNKYINRDKWCKVSQYAKNNGTFIYNGLDRVDSSKPHDKDNVVPCCFICNRAKSKHNTEKFKKWVCNVYELFIKDSVDISK